MRITKHGASRVRERMGVPKRAVARMASKALTDGRPHSEFSGSFKRYLDGVFLDLETANNMRVYSQHLFVFNKDVLITAWLLPSKFRNI